jgi:hypothetical protein
MWASVRGSKVWTSVKAGAAFMWKSVMYNKTVTVKEGERTTNTRLRSFLPSGVFLFASFVYLEIKSTSKITSARENYRVLREEIDSLSELDLCGPTAAGHQFLRQLERAGDTHDALMVQLRRKLILDLKAGKRVEVILAESDNIVSAKVDNAINRASHGDSLKAHCRAELEQGIAYYSKIYPVALADLSVHCEIRGLINDRLTMYTLKSPHIATVGVHLLDLYMAGSIARR